MTLEIKRNSNEIVIEVAGRLDATTAPSLDKTINEILPEMSNIILNFKNLEYISSAGLRVLLSTQKKTKNGQSIKLIHVCDSIMDILEMTGFADILTIE